jgi:purine-binding chemotaxis protein CheW
MDKYDDMHTYIEEEDIMKNKYLTCFIEEQVYGISIVDVVQITGMQEITEIPEFPYYAKGVINLRGTIVPIIDLRLRLKKEGAQYDERTCIIITNIEGLYIGFIVDSVNDVTNIFEDDISAPPQMGNGYVNTYITGIAKLNNEIVVLIDLKKVLNEKEIESFNMINEEIKGA